MQALDDDEMMRQYAATLLRQDTAREMALLAMQARTALRAEVAGLEVIFLPAFVCYALCPLVSALCPLFPALFLSILLPCYAIAVLISVWGPALLSMQTPTSQAGITNKTMPSSSALALAVTAADCNENLRFRV